MQNISSLTAVKLRIILIVSMTLMILCAGIGFWFFRGYLTSFANDVNTAASQAQKSNQDIAKLRQLQTELSDSQVAITRAAKIVADSKSYLYQDQIINDINNYAAAAGIKVASYTFSAPATAATPGGAAAPTPVGGAPTTAAPAGLKVTTAVISLSDGKNSFQAVMNFLKSIEQNLTKMNLSGISLQGNSSGSGDDVTLGSITVGVYTK